MPRVKPAAEKYNQMGTGARRQIREKSRADLNRTFSVNALRELVFGAGLRYRFGAPVRLALTRQIRLILYRILAKALIVMNYRKRKSLNPDMIEQSLHTVPGIAPRLPPPRK